MSVKHPTEGTAGLGELKVKNLPHHSPGKGLDLCHCTPGPTDGKLGHFQCCLGASVAELGGSVEM